jgi:hypothetical protein
VFGTTGIGGPFGAAIRRSIVCAYVRNSLREHGCLPVGRHRVSGAYQRHSVNFETLFPGKAAAALAAFGRRIDSKELLGPPADAREGAFERMRKQYLESPARFALRAWLKRQVEVALRGTKKQNGTDAAQ